MGHELPGKLTALLGEVRAGDPTAKGRLVQLIYDELRTIAAALMRRERPDHTLQAAALAHEAALRLLSGEVLDRAGDRHYVFAAAQAMRQILIDHARHRLSEKAGGGRDCQPLDEAPDEALAGSETQPLDRLVLGEVLLDLDEALQRLIQRHPRPGLVVLLRFFFAMPVPEVARVLEVSETTVQADWRLARAWLRGELGGTSA